MLRLKVAAQNCGSKIPVENSGQKYMSEIMVRYASQICGLEMRVKNVFKNSNVEVM